MSAQLQYQGTGRRKNAVARVRLVAAAASFRLMKEA